MTNSLRGWCASVLLLAAVSSTSFAQGPLAPAAAPAPSMKTLAQIEARIPITNAGFVADLDGASYYLTRHLMATNGQTGILVMADGVTIDLNGFTLTGPGTNSGHGIEQAIPFDELRVHNGRIRFFQGPSKAGIRAQGKHNQFDHIEASYNYDGIGSMDNAIVSDCMANMNVSDGIYVGGGSRLTDCTALQNGSIGLYLGSGGSLSGCSALENGYMGIYAVGGSSLMNCAARGNKSYGIYVGDGSSLAGCLAFYNGDIGFVTEQDSALANCESSHNFTNGFVVQKNCCLQGCVASRNGFQGFLVTGNGNTLLNCTANENASSGIFIHEDYNRIEGCHMTGNDFGLYFRHWGPGDEAENNFAVHNTAIRNTTLNYFYDGTTNNIGPIETYGTFSSSWANFSY